MDEADCSRQHQPQTYREAARWIPRSIEQASEAHIATTRIQSLLLLPEAHSAALLAASTAGAAEPEEDEGAAAVLAVEDSDFSWGDGVSATSSPHTPPPQPPQLRGVSLAVRPGELVIVAGPVGAGKSTLIEAILGEANCVRGEGARVRPGIRLAYCAQQPWIQAGAVRDNIVFARAEGGFDPGRYERAVAACALRHDLDRLVCVCVYVCLYREGGWGGIGGGG